MNNKNKKVDSKKSSLMQKLGRKLTSPSTAPSPINVREYDACGFHVVLKQQEITKRSATFDVAEEELSKIPKEAILSQEPKEPAKFEYDVKEPSFEGSDKTLHEQAAELDAYHDKRNEAKKRFEAAHVDDEPMIIVTALIPVRVNVRVLMDGHEVKIFHTLRGPVMGLVKGEDLHRAFLYSPCFIDPNIERGRVHYLPIAFAGFEYILYKSTSIGESIPQEAEIEGYPFFIERNKKGDYMFRMKAAYHHIDADYPDDARLISADGTPRDALEGLIATSDTRERKGIERVRQIRTAQQAANKSK